MLPTEGADEPEELNKTVLLEDVLFATDRAMPGPPRIRALENMNVTRRHTKNSTVAVRMAREVRRFVNSQLI